MATTTSRDPHLGDLPRGLLHALLGLIVAALLVVVVVRTTGMGSAHVPDAPAVSVRELRFEDRPDGGIAVIDVALQREIERIAPGQDNFLRGTLRGLARERRRQGIGSEPPFRLSGRADGRLTLEDPSTGHRVDLESFGPANSAVFAHLMQRDRATP